MKKITATAVAVLILLQGVCFMSACKQDDSPETFDYASLYRRADVALYYVKRHGRNGYAFYESLPEEDR